MTLRKYQEEAVEAMLAALARSGSAVLQMPTGAGKTKAATEIIKRHGKTVWFVCHRQEIERQASRAFSAAGIDHGIVSPRGEAEYDKRVQIVSVATLTKRIADLPLPTLVIWDECHHVPAKSWAEIREALTDAQHLGLTATPERLDGKGLKDWFAELIVGPPVAQLIDDGFLSPFRYFAPSDPDLTAAKLQAGDYRKRDADAVMNTPVLIGDAVSEYKRNATGKRAIAFCTSVEASQALAARFNAEGIPARHVDGTTSDDERAAAIDALATGAIKVLSNVEVFTEGFDVPGIDAAILMRPTKSPTLLLQMIGRALRVAPGKSEAIIMDHAGLHRDHGWFADAWHWSLDGGATRARRRASERGPRSCPECKEVRAERVEMCTCGYEFPTGREIGEFDGVLSEIRGEVPEGCVTVNTFAERHKVNHSAVHFWTKSGLPRDGRFIPVDVGDKWVWANSAKISPPGTERIAAFARRHGVAASTVRSWVERGLPAHHNKYVNSSEADEWISANVNIGIVKQRGERLRESLAAPDGYLGFAAFAKRHGFSSHTTTARWVEAGLPADGRLINLVNGDKWIAINGERVGLSRKLAMRHSAEAGYERQIDFAKRHGITAVTVARWIKRQYFSCKLGLINSTEADLFVAEYVLADGCLDERKIRLRRFGTETMIDFGKRIGVSGSTPFHWKKFHDFPYDPELGIPIQAGLEWVRDNRPDIIIPPEAWPSHQGAANDNEASTKAA